MLARMPKPVKTCLGSCLVFLLIHTIPVPSLAESADEREREGWVPSFAVQSGINTQNATGSLATGVILGPWVPFTSNPNNPPEPQILPGSPQSDSARMMTPYVGLSLELMTPALRPRTGPSLDPRGFVHVDVSYSFAPEYNLPSIGNPGPFSRASPPNQNLYTESILGQGGRNTSSVKPLLVSAGAGIAFTFHAGDRVVRVKPSVEYLREEVTVSGLVRRAVRNANPSRTLDDFRTINLAAHGTYVYHGLGPGLEVELETGRTGPFVVALYLGARAWSFFDNEERVLQASNQYAEEATLTFEKNDWAFSGNLGFRFRFVPE